MPGTVVLSGGVGGARFVRGLADVLGADALTVIGNVGDDDEFYGLHVSPDLDSLVYALAGLNDERRGWGRRGETWNARETALALGDAETWFQLGDRDLGLHLVRTKALRAGEPLSSVTARIAKALGVGVRILPATDHRLRTIVETPRGALSLQEWFVRRRGRDRVEGIRFEGAAFAKPAPGVAAAIEEASHIVIAPSNPYISVWPILAVRSIREGIQRTGAPVVAVSPIVGDKSVKGPADRMLRRLAGGTSPVHVAGCYAGLIDALVVDRADAAGAGALEQLGIRPHVTATLMRDRRAARRVAKAVLEAAGA
jgi:LPPG:FO 2-phospho-L-lactate transferase